MIVVDTDVLIDALKGRRDTKERIAEALRARAIGTTTINVFELLSGAKSGSSLKSVRSLLDALRVYPVDHEAGAIAADVRRHLEKRGEGIGMADYLVAGVCLSRGLPLLTRNLAHFQRVPELALASQKL
ncbi:MAG: type II toxin-antitoxin system VapC family toxin [Vicinamibacteria bacterium]